MTTKTMKTAVIGTGRMGVKLAGMLAGHLPAGSLLWASRDKAKAAALIAERGLSIEPASHEEALNAADILIPALWHQDQTAWLPSHQAAIHGKIVINITNPFNAAFDDFTTDYNTSSAEELQKLAPGARFVGAFKNTFWEVLSEPERHGLKSDVFVTSDDEEAKRTVMSMLQGLPFRFLDGGRLANNRTIERMTLFSRELAKRYGTYPLVSWRLWGLGDE
ncbi:NADPH-dependent F420 reductase [Paenibacillus hamazuiensis]|uniref:NADPH-dependent F420 reductase n=1 Tax=Paenibacillus hamazuiensis TaxID=2936508 RepID=UPI00200CF848|nr:NAD(P)-binding domain-containing protein [Paenibacillus hamazuiensis]